MGSNPVGRYRETPDFGPLRQKSHRQEPELVRYAVPRSITGFGLGRNAIILDVNDNKR